MDLFDYEREIYILENIGTCAVLDQCAEECCELAQACLKMGKKIRGQNPTPKNIDEIEKSLKEELADVSVCISVLMNANDLITYDELKKIFDVKIKRWVERIMDSKIEKE